MLRARVLTAGCPLPTARRSQQRTRREKLLARAPRPATAATARAGGRLRGGGKAVGTGRALLVLCASAPRPERLGGARVFWLKPPVFFCLLPSLKKRKEKRAIEPNSRGQGFLLLCLIKAGPEGDSTFTECEFP